MCLLRSLPIFLALFLLSTVKTYAGPTDPVLVSLPPTGQGDAFVPGTRLIEDLPGSYIEQEYFVSGAADLYNYANNPPSDPTDIVAIQQDVPYTTRIIVRRPERAKDFNGTVVIEWFNSTAGFDTAPAWDPSAEYFTDRGIIYVGVTNSTTSINYLVGGCRLFGILPPTCGTRYSALSLPENGLAYEMMSQIANLLKSPNGNNPLPADYAVTRLMHVGESQQAGSLVTYASAFHLDGVNDGYFIQAGINARPINFGPICGQAGSPSFPSCTPRLQGSDGLVSTDVPVPVYQVITQTDFETLNFNTRGRQPDTPTFRYYEVAGGSHNTVHIGIELIPAGLFGPDPILLEDLCQNELNTTADGPVFVSYVLNALWQRMEEQIDKGSAPPAGVLLEDIAGVLVRDAQNNVLGGVRLPSMDAPLATYASTNIGDPNLPPVLINIGNLACRLSGSVFAFDQTTLDGLYKNHGAYVKRVGASANALKKSGLLLQDDAQRIKRAASQSAIGK